MQDSSTWLQYLRARWYDPSVGRFINKDTYEGDITNPLKLNLFTYAINNPLKYTDPTGHDVGAGADFNREQDTFLSNHDYDYETLTWVETDDDNSNVESPSDNGDTQPDSSSSILGTVGSFSDGAWDSSFNNLSLGIYQGEGDTHNNSTAYNVGMIIGDIVSFVGGLGETLGGGIITGGGILTTETGVGIPVAAGGVAITGTGVATMTKSASNLGEDIAQFFRGSDGADKQFKGTPGNNQAQNKQVRDIATKYNLNKVEQRQLHDEISGMNYSYKQIEEIARDIKGK